MPKSFLIKRRYTGSQSSAASSSSCSSSTTSSSLSTTSSGKADGADYIVQHQLTHCVPPEQQDHSPRKLDVYDLTVLNADIIKNNTRLVNSLAWAKLSPTNDTTDSSNDGSETRLKVASSQKRKVSKNQLANSQKKHVKVKPSYASATLDENQLLSTDSGSFDNDNKVNKDMKGFFYPS